MTDELDAMFEDYQNRKPRKKLKGALIFAVVLALFVLVWRLMQGI